MPLWLSVLNTIVAIGSAGFGAVAILRPTLLAPVGTTARQHFFPLMYAARAIPLGLAVVLALWLPVAPIAGIFVLAIAAAAQCADILIGLGLRIWGMAAGATFATCCHGAALLALLNGT